MQTDLITDNMKEEKYIQKAISLFKSEGMSMPIEIVAERIGVTKKTLYNNFESKDGLISRCMEKIMEDFRSDMECLCNPSLGVQESFVAGINALRAFFKGLSSTFLTDFFKLYPNRASSDHTIGFEIFTTKLADHIKWGQREKFYRKEIDSDLTAKYIAFSVFGYFRKYILTGGEFSAEHYFSQVIDFNLNALLTK